MDRELLTPDSGILPRKVKIWGSIFLFAQLLFAANNYGPQRIPLLNLVFSEPWIAAKEAIDITNPEAGSIYLEDASSDAGLLSFRRARMNETKPNYLEVMGGGVAAGDFDGDGYEDLFFVSVPSFHDNPEEKASNSSLFRNMGDGTFIDVTDEAGLTPIKGYPQGVLFFDFNNNGRQDLYIASYDGGQLFQNEGGYFSDITGTAGLNLKGLCGELPCFSSAASAADYDRDGYLDLLIVNNVDWDIDDPSQYDERRLFPAFFKAQESFLFRNNGDGTFTNVTAESGVRNEEGKGLSAVWFDFNNDSWPDVYFANDLTRNKLYLNNKDGTFRELGAGTNVNEVKSSMGVNAADFNQNGFIDLITTNLEGSKISLFRNMENRFDYATNYTGLNPSGRSSGWGVEFTDLNRDGYPDLVMAAGPVWDQKPTDADNLFFLNNGDGKFTDVTTAAGDFSNRSVSRGLAVLDADNDGQPDLVFSNIDGGQPQLLMNRSESDYNWLKLHLQGTFSNRDAVGARVIVKRTDGRQLVQEVKAGGSYQSASTKALFFGLQYSEVEQIIINWPSGQVNTVEQPAVNQTLHIRETDKKEIAVQHGEK